MIWFQYDGLLSMLKLTIYGFHLTYGIKLVTNPGGILFSFGVIGDEADSVDGLVDLWAVVPGM